MARFQTVIKSARFAYSPYTATEMQGFAQVLGDSIRARIQSGQNIYDQAAAPLKPGFPGPRGYSEYKAARVSTQSVIGLGAATRCGLLKVLSEQNRVAIGSRQSCDLSASVVEAEQSYNPNFPALFSLNKLPSRM
jgi:hypothetical protein